jgi:hypothetical protein
MKHLLIAITVAALAAWLPVLTSCTKQYIEHSTCRRYLELCDKFDEDGHYLRTDTLWPSPVHVAQIACDSELLKIEQYVPFKQGCANGGWQEFRYVVLPQQIPGKSHSVFL